MTTPVRRRLRLAWRGAWYALAGLLVLMALVSGIASQLLPLVERHPERIAAWLSARAQRPVTFDHVETAWTRRGPLLRVDGLRIGTGAAAVPIGGAEILVSQYAGLLPGRSFTELRLRGLELVLERDSDGRWQVRGLPGQAQSDADPIDALQRLGELQVIDGRLTVIAPALGLDATLPRVNLRLRVHGDRVRAAARAWIRDGAAPLHGVLDLDRSGGDGRAHLALARADLAAWGPLLRAGGLGIEAGTGRAAAWADLRGHRIVQVTVDADLQAMRLRAAAPDAPGAILPDAQDMLLAGIQARARWQVVANGWRLDAPLLRVQEASGQNPARLDGLVVAGGAQRALLAKEIAAAPLLALAALSDRVPPDLRAWLRAAQPGGRLQDVVVVGRSDGPLRASARISDLHFAASGDAPGVSGLSGTLQGDSDGVVFAFDPRQVLRFDWPRGFGVPHEVVARGRLVGWRAGRGWQLQTPGLRIDGKGYGAAARGGMDFQGDGTRPRVDLAVALDDAAIAVSRRFWVRHKMSAATVERLDGALLGGRVHNGRALVSGDLDDWPFAGGNGLFRAEADLVDAAVRFHPQWPAAAQLHGQLVFEGDGVQVAGRAALAGIPVTGLEARIPHFGKAELEVRAEASTDAAQLLALLRQSPPREAHGETLQALRASGPVNARFALDLPLHTPGGRAQLRGDIDLRGARLADSRWDLTLADVRGQARYDQAGFTAERLVVVRDGQRGVLSLRAGVPHVRDRGQAFEAELVASLSAADLLQRAPQLAWLQPHVSGRSTWTTQVSIPASARVNTAPGSGRLQLRSDLVGTRLGLPAPMDKPASAALPTTVETRLPLGEGEITVALGNRLALRASSRQGRTGVRVVLG
ncbi:MAG: TIGR02099 family protein, partial [Pseudomonadota bacterium]|nr:TIGR02099 family protein [Pseudomonadota bacterium]